MWLWVPSAGRVRDAQPPSQAERCIDRCLALSAEEEGLLELSPRARRREASTAWTASYSEGYRFRRLPRY
eukprot:679568-Prorocentrum_minimum.AAC.1